MRKQLKTQQDAPSKILVQARGPYQVLEQVHPGTYRIQKLSFARNLGCRGKPYKEAGSRMEKLPNTILLHKNTDGMDTQLAMRDFPLTNFPLENTLRAINYGRYFKAPNDPSYAYD